MTRLRTVTLGKGYISKVCLSPDCLLGGVTQPGEGRLSETSMYTVHSAQCTVHSAQCTVQCTQYTVHSTQYALYTVQCTLYTEHSTLCTVQCTQYTVHSALCTVYSALYTVHTTTHPCRQAPINCECSEVLFAPGGGEHGEGARHHPAPAAPGGDQGHTAGATVSTAWSV